jgi:hypothetical protein
MNLDSNFKFTSVSGKITEAKANPLAPIDILLGTWLGHGFNQIWRPQFGAPGQDHFLELNETTEKLEFDRIPGDIPNRGMVQQNINLHGLRFLQQVKDAHVLDSGRPAGIHVENGMWLTVPQTGNPQEAATVVRMGSVPHGTAFVAQGTASPDANGGPQITTVSITPFGIGNPANLVQFSESTLKNPSQFRTASQDIPNVTQAMVDNPNVVLTQAITGQNIISTRTLQIFTAPLAPAATSGGISNIAFLSGGAEPNAQAAQMEATFWIETVTLPDGSHKTQLQYSQKVLLNFKGLSWPHVSAATLIKI